MKTNKKEKSLVVFEIIYIILSVFGGVLFWFLDISVLNALNTMNSFYMVNKIGKNPSGGLFARVFLSELLDKPFIIALIIFVVFVTANITLRVIHAKKSNKPNLELPRKLLAQKRTVNILSAFAVLLAIDIHNSLIYNFNEIFPFSFDFFSLRRLTISICAFAIVAIINLILGLKFRRSMREFTKINCVDKQ